MYIDVNHWARAEQWSTSGAIGDSHLPQWVSPGAHEEFWRAKISATSGDETRHERWVTDSGVIVARLWSVH